MTPEVSLNPKETYFILLKGHFTQIKTWHDIWGLLVQPVSTKSIHAFLDFRCAATIRWVFSSAWDLMIQHIVKETVIILGNKDDFKVTFNGNSRSLCSHVLSFSIMMSSQVIYKRQPRRQRHSIKSQRACFVIRCLWLPLNQTYCFFFIHLFRMYEVD